MPDDDSGPAVPRSSAVLSRVRAWVDPLVVMIVAVLVVGLLWPARGGFAEVLEVVRTGAIVVLFFLYGARMPTHEVLRGLRNWRLQGSMLAATYVVFPVLGLAAQLVPDAFLAPELQTGLLYLSLLPSTVQASIVFTSLARGNVAGAITGATISNVVGVLLTPLLVTLPWARRRAVSTPARCAGSCCRSCCRSSRASSSSGGSGRGCARDRCSRACATGSSSCSSRTRR